MRNNKAYIGLSCTGHDGAVAIFENGELRFSEASERYRQSKFAVGQAPDDHHYCRDVFAEYLNANDIVLAKSWSNDAETIWLDENQRLSDAIKDFPQHKDILERLVAFHRNNWDGFMGPSIALAGHGAERAAGALGKQVVDRRAYDHHLCHAAFAAWSAPFESAAVMVMDGQGEGRGTAFWHYRDGGLHPVEKEDYSGTLVECYGSLGLYYGIMVCLACSFEPVSGEEWKIMGLAPYGRTDEELYSKLKKFYEVDGLSVNCTEDTVSIFLDLISNPVDHKTDFDKAADYAHTFQRFFSEIATQLLQELQKRTGETNLIITGGCGLNSSFNGRVVNNSGFSQLFVPSAPADDGNAAGAAILAAHADGQPISGPAFQTPYLGSAVSDEALENAIANTAFLPAHRYDDEDALIAEVARRLADGQVVGWVQGRAEFGPRALGNRSILADPRNEAMKDKVNRVVKFREGFRPFAPSVLHEVGDAWFEDYQDSPYMERTLTFKEDKRASVPAVCHADNTGRVQSVTPERNRLYHKLISEFDKLTGVPMLMNTSLNVMGKPIVHSVDDAMIVFLNSGMECLVIGNVLLAKDAVGSAASSIVEREGELV